MLANSRIEFFHETRKEWIPGRKDLTWERAKEYGVPVRLRTTEGIVVRQFHPMHAGQET